MSAHNNPERDGIRPYTTAHALPSGWAWDVPLYHRNGTGYVYASAFCSEDEAERTLRTHLGESGEGMSASHLRMRVGRVRRLWAKNCVAIGLAAMFVEPLESTSIFFTEYQLSTLVSLFPDRSFPQALTDRYNETVIQMYEQIRDFIVMHYCTTQREDTPFWRTMRHDLTIPDTLKARLDAVRAGIAPTDYREFHVFRAQNWAAILSGMRFYPERSLPILEHAPSGAAEKRFRELAAHTEALSASTSKHYDYIRSLHEPDALPSVRRAAND
jgi:tryptophan halogenase